MTFNFVPRRAFVFRSLIPVFVAATFCLSAAAQVRVLVDQVGYDLEAPKQALVMVEGSAATQPLQFALVDDATGATVFSGSLQPSGQVHAWTGRTFWTADFGTWHNAGRYSLRAEWPGGQASSCAFTIAPDLLERQTLSNVLYYFKGQRASGDFDAADRHLARPDAPGSFIDAHGGWYDATGDYGIHLSHQNPTSYFNPQQVPLVAWSLLKSYQTLTARNDDDFTEYRRRLLDEGLFGADYLVRIRRPGGSFYETITAPGRDKLAKDRVIGNPNWRTQIKKSASDSTEAIAQAAGPHAYEASLRAGGGMAIAALALASTMPQHGDFQPSQYLRTAEEAFDFLSAHNRELLNDGTENILDDYCGLMAATELYRATHADKYRDAAHTRAASLIARLTTQGSWHDYWRADAATRPFFHPSDAGLPVISLLEYYEFAAPADQQTRSATPSSALCSSNSRSRTK